jgi:hypothetical protein
MSWRERRGGPETDPGAEPDAELGRVSPGKIASTSLIGDTDPPRRPVSPGKRTLTMSLPPVQARSRPGGAADPVAVGAQGVAGARAMVGNGHGGPMPAIGELHQPGAALERAAEGIAGAGEPLPFLPQIQSSFGRHDVRGVEAHVGGPATTAANALGAEAYATGNHVAFGAAPSLHTAAHEAAHVVQQRGRIQLRDGLGRAGDEFERHADQVADLVVAGRSAESLLDQHAGDPGAAASGSPALVQRNPLGGALVTEEQQRAQEAAARDVFPGPIKMMVLGDPFEVRLEKVKGALALHITYLGPHPVDATAPSSPFKTTSSRTVSLAPEYRRPAGVDAGPDGRAYAAQLVARGDDRVVFDLYSDGGYILEVRDRVDGDGQARFDRRTHVLDARLNGFPTMPAFLAVHLPVGAGGDEHASAVSLDFNGDAFTLRARRHGDAAAVMLSLAHASGESAVVVPLRGGPPKRVELRVLGNDGRTIDLDLDGDGQADARLVHTVRAPRRLAPGMRPSLGGFHTQLPGLSGIDDNFYVHEVATYDVAGVRVGDMVQKLPGHPGAIPTAQDAMLSPAPGGAAQPDWRAPVQGDVPGETPRAVRHPGRDWEVRIDGDGDRTKEIVLRFAGRESAADQPRTYTLSVTQLSSGASAARTFLLTADQARSFDAFGPNLIRATDGEGTAKIQLGSTPSDAPIMNFYEDPFYAPSRKTYRANLDGAQGMVFSLPEETRARPWMSDFKNPPRDRAVGTIQTVDVEMSEYRDRFRLTAEKVDSSEVLLGVSAIADEGPVAGFSARLRNIEEVRLEPDVALPTVLRFFVRKDWGFSNLALTSALDPPKDPKGRIIEGPPSAHRDHRVTLQGDVLIGRHEHTFRVRDGRFVAGWEKSIDNRHAAGAAQAVGVLEEQSRHPHVDEMRIQIDTALDAEIQKAVKLGWIDGMSAEAWSSLGTDMLFVQAQAASGKVASDRASRAADAAEVVGSWLSDASRNGEVWIMSGSVRRPAPGETVASSKLVTGTGFNTHSGETWGVKDSVLTEMRAAGYGARMARELHDGQYVQAIINYGKLRSGVNRWIAQRFATDPKFGPTSPEAARMKHLIDLGDKLGEIEGVQRQMRELDASIDAQVTLAGERGLVDPAIVAAWDRLKLDMISLAASTSSEKLDATLVERAVSDTGAIDGWLAGEAGDRHGSAPHGRANPYSGEQQIQTGTDTWATVAETHGRTLLAHLQSGSVVMAGESYRQLRGGVVRWIAAKTEVKFGKGSAEANEIAGLQRARESKRDVTRIAATFVADDSYEKMPDKGSYKQQDFGKYRQIPLQLFVWADGDQWHIRDLHNPKNAWEGSVPFKGEKQPPEALFQELDHKRHLPKGTIRYLLPDGTGGRIRCKAAKEWYEWVSDIATVFAVVGIAFMTLGMATPLVVGAYATVAFAASTVAGTVASIGEMADGVHHGFADTTMIMLNVLDIAGNLASLGMMGGGKLAMGASRAATVKGGANAWTGAWANLARAGSLSYRPLAAVSIYTGAASLLVMVGELETQLAEIDKTIKDPHERQRAKAALLARFAVMGGMVLLSIKGDMPDLRTGGPRIVLDKVNGVTVARVGDVKLGKQSIDLPEHDARMHAQARWQSQDIEMEAARGNKQAGEMLGDAEFQRWYAKWMEMPEKVLPGSGRPVVAAPPGAPPDVVKRLQDMVNRGDVALHEQAFRRADDIAELRAASKDLDIDPRNATTWPATREKLVERLGGGARAERLVARYEAARLGASGDVGKFATERAELNKVLPDSEVDRVRSLFPEHEVYVTTDPARAGQPRPDAIEVAVVVKNGTEPDVMHAIEQRARGQTVRPDPDYLKRERMSQNETIPVRAKVMTEDQFFGMATASRSGKGGPRYHRLGEDAASSVGLGGMDVRAQGPGRYAVDTPNLVAAHDAWKARDGKRVSKLRYDADTNTTYFEVHGPGGKGTVRVEAALPGRITSAADWKLENRIVGTEPFADVARGQEILRAIARGDVGVITRELGIPLPKGFNTADGLEFGLGQLPDGRYVIVRGEIAAVDWSKLPGVKAVGHTHPSVKGNDLDEESVGGPRRVSLDRLQNVADVPLRQRGPVYPSPVDVQYMSHHRIRDHRVFTPFVVKDGFVMKPDADHAGDARLEFRIVDAVEAGRIDADGTVVHRATVIGIYEGREVLRNTVYVTPPTKAEPDGLMYVRPPDGFVALPQTSVAPQRSGRTGMATRAESEAALIELDGRLTDAGRRELAEISQGKKPEEVWGILTGKGDPVKFLEGRANRKSSAGDKAAAKDERVTRAHETLRQSGFFDSPVTKKMIANGDSDGVRGRIAEYLAVANARAEFGSKPNHVVLDDIDVSRRFGNFKTRAEAEASLPEGVTKPIYELDGAVWERLTNFDVLVLDGRRVVKMDEVKSGKNDRASEAKTQQQKGLNAMTAMADGDPNIRLHHRRRTDITDQVDARTAGPDQAVVTGPDNKGFEGKLGVTTTDLTRMTDEIMKGTAGPGKPGATGTADPGKADAPGTTDPGKAGE